MKCIDVSKFNGIKQRSDDYCTFACIEMCLKYLNEQKITQEEIRINLGSYFRKNIPMFQIYEENFTKIYPNFKIIRFNDSNVENLIQFIKENINNRYPVIQSRFTHQKLSHAVIIICYDNVKFKYYDPGPNKVEFVQFNDYVDFLGTHRDTLIIKRII